MPELLAPPTQRGVPLALEFVPPNQILHDLLDHTVLGELHDVRLMWFVRLMRDWYATTCD